MWNLLAAVKTEFGKYGEVSAKVQKKLQEASNTVETVAVRSRAIQRKLRDVEELPAPDVQGTLMLAAVEGEDDEGEVDTADKRGTIRRPTGRICEKMTCLCSRRRGKVLRRFAGLVDTCRGSACLVILDGVAKVTVCRVGTRTKWRCE